MVVAIQPFVTVVIPPFEVKNTIEELSQLAERLGSLDGEIRVVMEATGNATGQWLSCSLKLGYMSP